MLNCIIYLNCDKYLVWQNPYSEQHSAHSGHPSGQATLSGSALKGAARQEPAPSPAPSRHDALLIRLSRDAVINIECCFIMILPQLQQHWATATTDPHHPSLCVIDHHCFCSRIPKLMVTSTIYIITSCVMQAFTNCYSGVWS